MFTSFIDDALRICTHSPHLIIRQINDFKWIFTVCKWVDNLPFFILMLDSIHADQGVIVKNCHEAVSMINDCISRIISSEWNYLVVLSWIKDVFVKSICIFFQDFQIGSATESAVESFVLVIWNYWSFAFKCFALTFKIGKINNVLVRLSKFIDDLIASFIGSGLIFHRMNNKNAFRNLLTFVACEPIWKDSIWGRLLWTVKYSKVNFSFQNVIDKFIILFLN